MLADRTAYLVAVAAVVVARTVRTAAAMSCNTWFDGESYPTAGGRVNVTGLWTLADEFLQRADDHDHDHDDDDGGGRVEPAAVDVRLRMNRRSSVSKRLNEACGYRVRVNGTDNAASRSAYLPAYERAVCGGGGGGGHVYRVQFVRAGGEHVQTVRLPRDSGGVASVELRANGKNYLTIDSACVRLRDGGGGGGAVAFCVDFELLKSCWCMTGGGPQQRRRSDYYLGFDGILLAMSRWNVREIVFRDVGALADGFRALALDANDPGARAAVCTLIDLVPGELDADLDSCPVEKEYATTAAAAAATTMSDGDNDTDASFAFRPERMDIDRLFHTCVPRRSDGSNATDTKNATDAKNAVDRRQSSGVRTSFCFTRVYLFFWSLVLYAA